MISCIPASGVMNIAGLSVMVQNFISYPFVPSINGLYHLINVSRFYHNTLIPQGEAAIFMVTNDRTCTKLTLLIVVFGTSLLST